MEPKNENPYPKMGEIKKIVVNPKPIIEGKQVTAIFITCPTCDGKKEVMLSCCSGEVVDEDEAMCPDCHEHLGHEECPDCKGTGQILAAHTRELTDKAPSMILKAEQIQDERAGK